MDVSKYNTSVNYRAAKIAGIRFAMVKATQGHALHSNHYLFTDSSFKKHIEGFFDAGIPVGAYHFFTGTDPESTLEEADYFIRTVEPYKDKISLFLACDAENYGNKYLMGMSREQLTFNVKLFCDAVKKAGFTPCHYTNTDHILNFIDLEGIDYPVWQAHYISGGGVKRPIHAGADLAIHQYTADGQLAGVVGKYDLNFGYAPTAKLIISSLTTIEDKTLSYIHAHNEGEDMLIKLADKLVLRSLNPVRNPTDEKLIALIRYYCGLNYDQAAYLGAYKWSKELFHKLYSGMVKA